MKYGNVLYIKQMEYKLFNHRNVSDVKLFNAGTPGKYLNEDEMVILNSVVNEFLVLGNNPKPIFSFNHILQSLSISH